MGHAGNGAARNKINKEPTHDNCRNEIVQVIEALEITVLPGVHDTQAPLSRRFAAKALQQVDISNGLLLGRPDSSQLSRSNWPTLRTMTERIEIPILADGDTGCNVTNVARTVRLLERSGVGDSSLRIRSFPNAAAIWRKAIIGVEEMAVAESGA